MCDKNLTDERLTYIAHSAWDSDYCTSHEATAMAREIQKHRKYRWVEGDIPPTFGKYYVRYLTDTGPNFCIAEWLEYDCCAPNKRMITMWLSERSRSMNALKGVTHFHALPAEPQENI